MEPLVSIIMPVYNRAHMIYRAIRCVQDQYFKDWELLVIDDGSTDYTMNHVDCLRGKDERIKCHWYVVNKGAAQRRNDGLKLAKGKYIAYLDSDDWWTPNKLKQQVELMETNGNMIMSYHDVEVNMGKRKYLWSDLPKCYSGVHGSSAFFHLLQKNFIPTSSVMIRKEKMVYMDTDYKVAHDWDAWLQVLGLCQSYEGYLGYLDDVLGVLNHQDSGLTNAGSRRKESIQIVKKWKNWMTNREYNKAISYYQWMKLFDHLPGFIQHWMRKGKI